MGKTKIKTIDDSVAPKKEQDQLVEKLKAELGIEKTEKPTQPKAVVKEVASSKKRSKKYLEASKDFDRSKTYPLPEALDIVKNLSYSKFDGTLETHIQTDQTGLRGFLQLPYVSGKKLRILAFAPSQTPIEGVFFGTDSTIEDIEKGKVNFDLVITTPEWMAKLTKVAKVLGPKGLMPSPKNGTIASGEDGIKKAVESFQSGKIEYKTEPKAPIIHLALGKLSQPKEQLEANVKTLLSGISKSKIKKVVLSPTMGPAVKLDLTST